MHSGTTLAPRNHSINAKGVLKIKKVLFRYFSAGVIALSLCVLVSQPGAASDAVREALNVCAGIIVPSLMPFFFISGLISSMGYAEDFSKVLRKPFKNISSAAAYACTPFILSILGGYPVGAISLAELVKRNSISAKQAEKLLPFCNNTGPAFIIGAVGGGIFASGKAGMLLYGCHIAAALILALICLPAASKTKSPIPKTEKCNPQFNKLLPESIKSALDKCFSICGFVIFFAVLREILTELGAITALALAINRVFGLEIGMCESLITGITELGGGIASMTGLGLSKSSLALAAFILGFGSLSVHCQTLAVVSEVNIKCARHFVGRILHGALSALLILIFSGIIRI